MKREKTDADDHDDGTKDNHDGSSLGFLGPLRLQRRRHGNQSLLHSSVEHLATTRIQSQPPMSGYQWRVPLGDIGDDKFLGCSRRLLSSPCEA